MDVMVLGVIMAAEVIMVLKNLVHLVSHSEDQVHLAAEVGLDQEVIEVITLSHHVEKEKTPMEKVGKDSEDIVITVEANMAVEEEKNLVRKPQLLILKL